jgi:hypothetical protein
MLHRFFDDACVYDLQPMLVAPAAAMNTMHAHACLVVFRQVHARLAQCLRGPMA